MFIFADYMPNKGTAQSPYVIVVLAWLNISTVCSFGVFVYILGNKISAYITIMYYHVTIILAWSVVLQIIPHQNSHTWTFMNTNTIRNTLYNYYSAHCSNCVGNLSSLHDNENSKISYSGCMRQASASSEAMIIINIM